MAELVVYWNSRKLGIQSQEYDLKKWKKALSRFLSPRSHDSHVWIHSEDTFDRQFPDIPIWMRPTQENYEMKFKEWLDKELSDMNLELK